MAANTSSLAAVGDPEPPTREHPATDITDELKKLALHSSHYLAGILASLGLGFISFPLFTRIFSVTDYGTIDLIAKVILLATALSKMGLQQAALRFYNGPLFSTDRDAAKRYYSTMAFSILASAGAVAALFLASIWFTPKSIVGRSLGPLLFLASVLIVIRAISSMLTVFLRVQERTKLVSFLSVVTKAAVVAAILLFIPWLGASVRSYYSGTIFAELIIVLAIGVGFARGGLLDLRKVDCTLLRAGIMFGAPLILYELATIVLDAGDRLLVRGYLGAHALGYYSVAYSMSDYVNNLLITPLNLALTPIYMKLWTSEGREKTTAFLSQGLDFFLMTAAGVLSVVAATSHEAVTLLASSKYRGANTLIPTIIAGLLAYTSHAFLSAGLIIYKKTVTVAKILATSAVLNVILNCILIPRLGLYAAALNTLISYLVCVLLLGWASSRLLPLRLNGQRIAVYAFASVTAWYCTSQITLASPIMNFIGRSACTLLVYALCLYVLDSRLRASFQSLTLRGRSRRQRCSCEWGA